MKGETDNTTNQRNRPMTKQQAKAELTEAIATVNHYERVFGVKYGGKLPEAPKAGTPGAANRECAEREQSAAAQKANRLAGIKLF
jgi:hypothetical protein